MIKSGRKSDLEKNNEKKKLCEQQNSIKEWSEPHPYFMIDSSANIAPNFQWKALTEILNQNEL